MKLFLWLIAFLALPGTAAAQTCSQANSECNSKVLTNTVIGAPSTGESNAKQLLNVVTNTANEANNKLLVNIVVIPGTATAGGVVPVSPLTHFR